MSTTFLTLRQRVRDAIGDGFREAVTTALTTSTNVVSTNLQKWDGGSDFSFEDWFVYVEDENNEGDSRVSSSYTSSSGTIVVRGASFSSDGANLATIMLTKYDPDFYERAIKNAIRKLDVALFVPLLDRSLSTNNMLPNGHFEDWTVSTVPDLYTTSSVTPTESTTDGLYRGQLGSSGLKLVSTGTNGYLYITSKDYPRLLDFQNTEIHFKSWAYANDSAVDAKIEIYTLSNDGTTTQTLTSDATTATGVWQLLELESQAINEDLAEIQFRFYGVTNGNTTYYDGARVTGLATRELFLPKEFVDGTLSEVWLQRLAMADDPVDDLHMRDPEKIYNWYLDDDGTYQYLILPDFYVNDYQLKLVGLKPLTVPSSDSASTELNDPELELLIAQSALELYMMMRGPTSNQDEGKFAKEIAYWKREVFEITPRFKMYRPTRTMRFRP